MSLHPAVPKQVTKDLEFHAPHADGMSLWIVKRHLGSGSWLCEIKGLEWSGTQKPFMANEILHAIHVPLAINSMVDEMDDFLQKQPEGAYLHYHNGFGQYIRKIVVKHEGKNWVKDVALVGNWERYDLPRRNSDGTENWPFSAKSVRDGELHDKLQISTLYEHPGFRPFGGARHFDPRTAEPIKLEIPPMTDRELECAKNWNLIKQIESILRPNPDRTDHKDPAVSYQRLKDVQELLLSNMKEENA